MSKDSARDGKWKKASVFVFSALDEDGALNIFETSQDKVTSPTFVFNTYRSHPTMKGGIIYRIHYRLNPANLGITFILRLWRITAANPYELNLAMLYESPAAQVDDTDYERTVEIPMSLIVPGTLYYSIEWSAAPGNTIGIIDVTGVHVE